MPTHTRVPILPRGLRTAFALFVLGLAGFSSGTARAALADAIEFYHAAFDHYFVTTAADEINKLDTGVFTGWQRTGQSFKVMDRATTGAGGLAVCRFYGNPAAGLDSHFYSASATECEDVAIKFAGVWILEDSSVFQVFLPNAMTGACPSGSVPIYRSWNNRADSNHRYTTDPATQQSMVAKGYVAEGYGPAAMPIAMCSPTSDPSSRPVCTLAASNGTPVVGTQITLSLTCSNTPTSFAWTGCASVTSACTASAPGAGPQTYSVIASNAGGASAPASVQVNWIAPPPPDPPPVCSLFVTANSETPTVGDLVLLNASCSNTPTSYTWSGCTSTTNVCRARGNAPGGVSYSVTATNGSGSGSASASVAWTANPAPPSGLCGNFPSALYSTVGTSNGIVYSLFFSEPPAFAWNGAWAVKFTVPSTAGAGSFGTLAAAEFGAPPTFREVTVSRTACDFRANDLTGNGGPFGRAFGNSATLPFIIGNSTPSRPGLAPGQTYYFNVRNWLPDSATISCSPSQQRCDALANILLPR
jgi:hypothetical protein